MDKHAEQPSMRSVMHSLKSPIIWSRHNAQAILAARREVVSATKAKQQTESQILDLKTQHESQSNLESNDLERLDVEIAELTMELSALNRQVCNISCHIWNLNLPCKSNLKPTCYEEDQAFKNPEGICQR